jgi:hypothetical protein
MRLRRALPRPSILKLMLNTAQEVVELASSLGTTGGLKRVKFEIDLLSARLAEKDLLFSPEELSAMSAALVSLSGAITEMNRIARAMLAEVGVSSDRVG